MSETVKKTEYFLITNRKALNNNYIKVPPIPIVVKNKMENLGAIKIDIDNCVVEVENDGSAAKQATIKSLNRMDGVLQITREVVERIVQVGFNMGVLEE